MDQTTLLKKAAARAALTPGNVISGAVAVAASAVLWNPLPLLLWGFGSAGWIALGSTGQRIQRLVLSEERQAAEAKVQADRLALLQKVQSLFADEPVAGWVRRGLLPDYLAVYRRLADARDKVAKVVRERAELEAGTQEGIVGQLDYMLGAYLQFVRERVGYLQILVNVRPGAGDDDGAGGAPAATPPPLPTSPVVPMPRARFQRPAGPPPAPVNPILAAPPRIEQRLAEIDAKVQRLKDLAEKEPATARTREWHVGILEKQRELLLDCQKRDQCVVAQLGAFADVFEVILGRVSASQFSATEVASYMGNVVEQIEETERFVAALRPSVDQLMGGLEGQGVAAGGA